MSAGWSKRLDIDPLADGQARLEFAIPLAEIVRVQPLLAAGHDGLAAGDVRFSRDRELVVADLAVRASLPLVCQRCLGAVHWAVDVRSRVVLVGTEQEGDAVPAGVETMLAPERRVSVRDLVEEELLLSVPPVPLHANPDECSAAPLPQDAATQPANVQRPFERLGELLKRDR
jgi:uncharacterized protein